MEVLACERLPRSRRASRQRGPTVSLRLSLSLPLPCGPHRVESACHAHHRRARPRPVACPRARSRIYTYIHTKSTSMGINARRSRRRRRGTNFSLTKSPGTVNEMKVVFLRASISDSWPVLFPTALTNNPDRRIDAGLSRGGSRLRERNCASFKRTCLKKRERETQSPDYFAH